MNINKIFELIEVNEISNDYQKNIDIWNAYFKGKVTSFHQYKEYNGVENVTRKLRSLGMPKMACEKWSDVIYNPETVIKVSDSYQDRLEELLSLSKFDSKINDAIEKGYALGTLGIITSKMGGVPSIQFASADMMYPIINKNRSGWAILTEYRPNVFYVSVHYNKDRDGNYLVTNNVIDFNENEEGYSLTKKEMKEQYNLKDSDKFKEPMLHIIKPAIANNIDPFTPYGISIYANAIDETQAVDIAYSALSTELITGKMLKFGMVEAVAFGEDGPIFPDEEGFYINKNDKTFSDGTTVKTFSPTLRSDSIINTLETNLNLFGRKVRLGDNAFTFKDNSVYTNTAQVLSTNSDFYKTRQKYVVIVSEALEQMVRALYLLDKGTLYKESVSVEFDDSIIHDKEQEDRELNFQLAQGLISQVYYWEKKLGLSNELAKQFVKQQQEEMGLIEMPDEEGIIE